MRHGTIIRYSPILSNTAMSTFLYHAVLILISRHCRQGLGVLVEVFRLHRRYSLVQKWASLNIPHDFIIIFCACHGRLIKILFWDDLGNMVIFSWSHKNKKLKIIIYFLSIITCLSWSYNYKIGVQRFSS